MNKTTLEEEKKLDYLMALLKKQQIYKSQVEASHLREMIKASGKGDQLLEFYSQFI
jgi:hypothetical protein